MFLWWWSLCSCRPLCWEGSRQIRGMLEPLHTFSNTTSDWVGLIKHLKYMTIYKQFAFSFLRVILISWMAEYILNDILQLSLFSSSNCSLFQCPSTSKTEKYLESLKTSVSLGCLKEDPFLHLSERTELLRGHPSNLHPLPITDLYLAKIFRPYNRWNFSALFASAVDSERRKNLSLWMNNDN